MADKKKIIIYGLGGVYQQTENYIKYLFDIVGYCDSNKGGQGCISPEDIPNYEYDYIYITSSKYFWEMQDKVLSIIGIDKKDKIISLYDVFGDFRNTEIRDQWVIEKLSDIPEGSILLDAGAGEQRYKYHCDHLKYISQDFGNTFPIK